MMSKNVIREIRNRVNAHARYLEQIKSEIASCYTAGQATAKFRYDGFSYWGSGTPQAIQDFFNALVPENEKWYWGHNGHGFFTDGWCRGVLELSEVQAQELAKIVDELNEDSPASIIGFGPVTGSEHQISVRSPNGHYSDAWQWNG